jgi:flagellar hook-associated protein 3 FlgL
MLTDNFMKNFHYNLRKLDETQNKLSSGRRIRFPSDDPIGTSHSLRLRSDLSQLQQYKENVDDGLSFLKTTESALRNIGDILIRIRELAVYGTNDILTPEDRQKIKSEVVELRNQIVQEANTSYSGRYIFAGYQIDKPPYEVQVTALGDVINYKGDEGKMEYEYGPLNTLQINFTGSEAFNFPPNPPGAPHKLFEVLRNLEDDLDSGNTANITNVRLGELDQCTANILKVRAELGARVNRMEAAKTRIEDDIVNFTEILSKTEDVDMAEIIMNLKMQENVYTASLAAGSRIIQPSLLDFLR